MGFNISGIVINKSFKSNLEELTEKFKWNLDYLDEIDFETASKNWKEEGICDIYFNAKGTFIFLNMDDCITPYKFQDCNILTFALSETSMAFNLNYTENEKEVRSIMQFNDKKLTDEGEKFDFEDDDTSETIWKKIESVLGESFWNIQPEEKCYRYRYSIITKPTAEKKITNDSIAQNIIKGKTEYCHILPPSTTIMFTESGNIEDYKSNNNSSLTNRINEYINLIIPTILILFSIYNFSQENYIITTILAIISLYFFYGYLILRNIGNDNLIKKDKIKKVRYLDKKKYDYSMIEIVHINQYGKIKKRPFNLDGKINDGSNVAENALEIMKINGLIE
jgi:hypothetical protein